MSVEVIRCPYCGTLFSKKTGEKLVRETDDQKIKKYPFMKGNKNEIKN